METHSPRLEVEIERVRTETQRQAKRNEEKVDAVELRVSANNLSTLEHVHRLELLWMSSWAIALTIVVLIALHIGFKQMESKELNVESEVEAASVGP